MKLREPKESKGLVSLSYPALRANFPDRFPQLWKNQEDILRHVAEHGGSVIESPTGTGKTAVEYAILRAAENQGHKPLFLITPNKTIVDQIRREFSDLKIALGRSEHPCLYYEEDKAALRSKERLVELTIEGNGGIRADEIPCSLLQDCPHRVDQETGETSEPGAVPCPYLQQKYEAKQGGIVLCTMAFYLFTQLFSREFDQPDVLVIDEAHRMAEVVRGALSYDITDYHLERSIALLEKIGAEEVDQLKRFFKRMKQIIKRKPSFEATLLDDDEISSLIEILSGINSDAIAKKVKEAMRRGQIDVYGDRVILRKLEMLIRDLRRYIHSFKYSLPGEGRGPLNYTCAFYKAEKGENDKVQYKLTVKCYYVAPLIKKILSPCTVAFSATIGNPDIFSYETGIKGEFLTLESNFPVENTRIYMPTDTPDLAVNSREKREPTRVLRKIAKKCKHLSSKGIRCLVVTVSNVERDKFMELAQEEKLDAISYGNGVTARGAALAFKNGKGDTLVGTAANYAEGVDLPKQIAPVIFVLRPGYPNPRDPGTIFEDRRFGRQRWQLWNYRVMIQALQVRGRNVRGEKDIGVTIFISQQFKRIVYASLPRWLEKAYVSDKKFDECVADAEKLLL